MEFREKAKIIDKRTMNRMLTRIAHQILETQRHGIPIVLVGIETRGAHLARRLAEKLANIEDEAVEIPCGALDITGYRDDRNARSGNHDLGKTNVPFDITGKEVVLVDDVLYTGRTVRAALDALAHLGRAESVRLAVLVDRGHRELPVNADFVGRYIPTSRTEYLKVKVREADGVDMVVTGEKL